MYTLTRRFCEKCGSHIPVERVKALPNTFLCVKCAENSSLGRKGYMIFGHKTAPTLVMVDECDKEKVRIADRANKRRR